MQLKQKTAKPVGRKVSKARPITVKFPIPKSAVGKLRTLAISRDQRLLNLGVLAVQIRHDESIVLGIELEKTKKKAKRAAETKHPGFVQNKAEISQQNANLTSGNAEASLSAIAAKASKTPMSVGFHGSNLDVLLAKSQARRTGAKRGQSSARPRGRPKTGGRRGRPPTQPLSERDNPYLNVSVGASTWESVYRNIGAPNDRRVLKRSFSTDISSLQTPKSTRESTSISHSDLKRAKSCSPPGSSPIYSDPDDGLSSVSSSPCSHSPMNSDELLNLFIDQKFSATSVLRQLAENYTEDGFQYQDIKKDVEDKAGRQEGAKEGSGLEYMHGDPGQVVVSCIGNSKGNDKAIGSTSSDQPIPPYTNENTSSRRSGINNINIDRQTTSVSCPPNVSSAPQDIGQQKTTVASISYECNTSAGVPTSQASPTVAKKPRSFAQLGIYPASLGSEMLDLNSTRTSMAPALSAMQTAMYGNYTGLNQYYSPRQMARGPIQSVVYNVNKPVTVLSPRMSRPGHGHYAVAGHSDGMTVMSTCTSSSVNSSNYPSSGYFSPLTYPPSLGNTGMVAVQPAFPGSVSQDHGANSCGVSTAPTKSDTLAGTPQPELGVSVPAETPALPQKCAKVGSEYNNTSSVNDNSRTSTSSPAHNNTKSSNTSPVVLDQQAGNVDLNNNVKDNIGPQCTLSYVYPMGTIWYPYVAVTPYAMVDNNKSKITTTEGDEETNPSNDTNAKQYIDLAGSMRYWQQLSLLYKNRMQIGNANLSLPAHQGFVNPMAGQSSGTITPTDGTNNGLKPSVPPTTLSQTVSTSISKSATATTASAPSCQARGDSPTGNGKDDVIEENSADADNSLHNAENEEGRDPVKEDNPCSQSDPPLARASSLEDSDIEIKPIDGDQSNDKTPLVSDDSDKTECQSDDNMQSNTETEPANEAQSPDQEVDNIECDSQKQQPSTRRASNSPPAELSFIPDSSIEHVNVGNNSSGTQTTGDFKRSGKDLKTRSSKRKKSRK
ncbi:predicted protein [Nematostella vectensis]|uniref:Nuclear receptor coactivator 6 TRADD-N domain-containing protein n=1 Tax=Nematostella vectensis TaxID=45351 RepID=A7SG15_NEMVE|nr:predicted protein [Nematostella vectensis]|eukprot:XP_001629421.1 predicted protein [Nematostella vectensis]